MDFSEEGKLAAKMILHIFQEWGQSDEERRETAVLVITFAGFNTEDLSFTMDSQRAGIPDNTLFRKFTDELKKCFPLGKIEDEIEAVKKVLLKYRELNKK